MTSIELGHQDYWSESSASAVLPRLRSAVCTSSDGLILFKVGLPLNQLKTYKKSIAHYSFKAPATYPKTIRQSPFQLQLFNEISTIPKWMHAKHGGIPTELSMQDRLTTGAFYLRSGRSLPFKNFAYVKKGTDGRQVCLVCMITFQPNLMPGKSEQHLAEEMKMIFILFQSLMREHAEDVVTAYTFLVESVKGTVEG